MKRRMKKIKTEGSDFVAGMLDILKPNERGCYTLTPGSHRRLGSILKHLNI